MHESYIDSSTDSLEFYRDTGCLLTELAEPVHVASDMDNRQTGSSFTCHWPPQASSTELWHAARSAHAASCQKQGGQAREGAVPCPP